MIGELLIVTACCIALAAGGMVVWYKTGGRHGFSAMLCGVIFSLGGVVGLAFSFCGAMIHLLIAGWFRNL